MFIKKFFKRFACIAIVLSLFTVLTSNIQAKQKDVNLLNTDELVFVDNKLEIDPILPTYLIEPRDGGILIFLAGIVIGYFIDGVIVYYSGHSAAEWTAAGLTSVKNFCNRNANLKSVASDGQYVLGYSTLGGQECVRPNPKASWVCKFSVD